MPDGGSKQSFVYRRAARGQFATLIMLAGPAGTGKTYSALRLGRGMAGPQGKVFVADTDNGRAKLYADEFEFEHLDLAEPFRPKLFEDAAIAAQQQGAAVLIIDNFMHEHAGPGGLLEYHEEELERMTRGDLSKRDALNMAAWIRPKLEHKHMRERLYQLNVPVILCCGAERKIAMVKQTEGQHKGKTIPVDQGFQPICGADMPYAMTISLMLLDVANPGVPVPIKALLPALKPILRLDRPLDEAAGARLAAWARGDRPGESQATAPKPPPASSSVSISSTSNEEVKGDVHPHGEGADPAAASEALAAADQPTENGPPPIEPHRGEVKTIRAGMNEIIDAMRATTSRSDHLAVVQQHEKRLEWFRKKRPDLFKAINAAIMESWRRTDPAAPPPQQPELIR